MTDRVSVGNLRVAPALYDFITNEALPGTDVDPDSGRNNRSTRANHTTHRRAYAPMHVGHDGDVLVDEGELRNIEELFFGFFFKSDTASPGLDGYAFTVNDIVIFLCHRILF